MNAWDILILLVVAGLVVLAFFLRSRRKASGRGSCCENCGACSLCKEKRPAGGPPRNQAESGK